jgi:DNA-binding transcriptional regulator YhcF (GntR family)
LQLSDIERKIVECFKNAESIDFSINEVAKLAGINRITASKYIEVLCARGILVHTRRIGKAKMFKIASEYEKAKAAAESKEEQPMIKVEFIKSFLKYRAGQIVLLEEGEAREYIKSGIAREKKA